MGATTYRLMAEFAASGEEGVDEFLTQVSKVVFSSTLTEPLTWANTRLVTADAVEAVRAMKEDSRIEMRTLGSVSLCRSLITAELVDRFRVVVFPVVTGATGQDRIYDGYPDIRLDLAESRTFEGGLQLLEYVPTVLYGPPGTTGERPERGHRSRCAPNVDRVPGQLLCKMSATVAEFEAVLIRLRSREGMKVARAKVNVGQSLVADARLAAEPSVSLSSSAGTGHR